MDPREAAPFVKWAGGKRLLAYRIAAAMPAHPQRYIEPFAGGAAVFFLSMRKRARECILRDANKELVTTYEVVRDQPDDLMAALEVHQAGHGREHYEETRSSKPADPVGIAARLIYLNRTTYNGLYRVNSKGEFNVGFGRYENPQICQRERLQSASRALQQVRLEHGSFEDTVVRKHDVAYCDPPYDSGFTAYTAEGFSREDQESLRAMCTEWAERGATVVTSNADTEFIRELYAGCRIERVSVPRSINSDTRKRAKKSELIIKGPWSSTWARRRAKQQRLL